MHVNYAHLPQISPIPHPWAWNPMQDPEKALGRLHVGLAKCLWDGSPCEDDADDAIWDGLRLDLPHFKAGNINDHPLSCNILGQTNIFINEQEYVKVCKAPANLPA